MFISSRTPSSGIRDSMHALNLTDRQKFFNKFGLTKQGSDVQLISSVQFTYKIYVLRKSYNKKS